MTTHGDSEVLERTCGGPGIRCPSMSSEKIEISDLNGWLKAGRTWSWFLKEENLFLSLGGSHYIAHLGNQILQIYFKISGISLIIMHGLGW